MHRITFVAANGDIQTIETSAATLLEAALNAGIPGVESDCGGVCSCGVCALQIDPTWAERVGPPHPQEKHVIDSFHPDAPPRCRLACQIVLADSLDGLIVRNL